MLGQRAVCRRVQGGRKGGDGRVAAREESRAREGASDRGHGTVHAIEAAKHGGGGQGCEP